MFFHSHRCGTQAFTCVLKRSEVGEWMGQSKSLLWFKYTKRHCPGRVAAEGRINRRPSEPNEDKNDWTEGYDDDCGRALDGDDAETDVLSSDRSRSGHQPLGVQMEMFQWVGGVRGHRAGQVRGCGEEEGSHDPTKSGKRSDLCIVSAHRAAFSGGNIPPRFLSPLPPHQPPISRPLSPGESRPSRAAWRQHPTGERSTHELRLPRSFTAHSKHTDGP